MTRPSEREYLMTRTGSRKFPAFLAMGAAAIIAGSVRADVDERDAPGKHSLDPYLSILRERGIAVEAGTLREFLKSCRPAAARAAVKDLGHADYARREAAFRALVRMPHVPRKLLQQKCRSEDPEVRSRARRILRARGEETERQFRRTLYAVLQVVNARRVKGLVRDIAVAVPVCDRYSRIAALEALAATVTAADERWLVHQLHSAGDVQVRIAAMKTLDVRLRGKTRALFARFLGNRDPMLRLTAAELLARRGERSALPVLVALLDAPQPDVREASVQTLRAVSGKRFGFHSCNPRKRRRRAVRAWRDWTARTAERPSAWLVHVRNGRTHRSVKTLLFCKSHNLVLAADPAGNVLWQRTVRRARCGEALSGGRLLVGSHAGRFVVEFDRRGTELWRVSGLPGRVMSVRRLPGGNTLVCCPEANKVLEIRPDKSIARQWTVAGQPTHAERLKNGNTLLSLQTADAIVEIDGTGKVVWKLDRMARPLSAQRLHNGNTLVVQSDAGRVVEVDRAGRVVWQCAGLEIPTSAQRLESGHTLICDGRHGVFEADVAGRIVWIMPLHEYCSAARRY